MSAAMLSALISALHLAPKTFGDLGQAQLVVARSNYEVTAEEASYAPWVRLSVPFPFERQTPLALRVTTTPPGRALRVRVEADRESRPLRVELAPLAAGDRVRVQVETFVLVRDRDLSRGVGVKIEAVERVPAELRPFLGSAPGVEPELPEVVEIAERLSREDLRSLLDDYFEYCRETMKPGPGPQGVREVLERKGYVCTGAANLGASVLRAAGVPTRILPCILVGMDQQEHYIVEVWTRELGWSRAETTLKLFPLEDARHLVLRVTYPDSARSAGSVPLFFEASKGARCAPDDTDHKEGSFQIAELLDDLVLEEREAESLESAARAAFAALATKPAAPDSKGVVDLVSSGRRPRKLGSRGRRLLEDLEERLERSPAGGNQPPK